MPKQYLAIDLGGTKCAAAIISEHGDVHRKIHSKISGKQGDEVFDALTQLADRLISEARSEIIHGIGVSVPGISYKSKGTVWAPNIPGWEAFPLREKMNRALENRFAITIDSDRAASIMGEAWLGAAAGCRDAIYLAIGTGIGAGILSGGRIIQGHNDIAGAIGWLALDDQYHEGYAQYGCFEYNASGDGITRLGRDLSKTYKQLEESSLPNAYTTATSILEGYQQEDPLALSTIEKAINYWGKATANLVSIFNPEKIIFGGGLFGPAAQFIDQIYLEAKKYAQPIAIDQVTFCPGKLGRDAQLLGAAKLFMEDKEKQYEL